MITLLSATQDFETLNELLIDTYWHCSTLDQKDLLFNISHHVHLELAELYKVSIQDGEMEYQPISTHIRTIVSQLKQLRQDIHVYVPRTPFASEIEEALEKVLALLK